MHRNINEANAEISVKRLSSSASLVIIQKCGTLKTRRRNIYLSYSKTEEGESRKKKT